MKDTYLRKAVKDDVDLLFQWANDKDVRANSFHVDAIQYKSHVKWFHEKLLDEDNLIYIYCQDNTPMGQIRLDICEGNATISYSIDGKYRGQGYGRDILLLMENEVYNNHNNILCLNAKVKRSNRAPQVLFEQLQYIKEEKESYILYTKEMTSIKKWISIIIPCYNAELYIDRCLESLVRQTIGFIHLELICVNDASKDQTWERLLEWERRYANCILLINNTQNMGPGEVRNIGMSYASSPYIGFVDADDWVDETMYEKLYGKAMEYDCEIVECLAKRVANNEQGLDESNEEDVIFVITSEEDRKSFITMSHSTCVWCRIYNKEWLLSLNIYFPKTSFNEDNYWISLVFMYVKTLYKLNEQLYYYFINTESLGLKRNRMEMLGAIDIEGMKVEEFKKRGLYIKYKQEIEYGFLCGYVQTLNNLFVKWDKVSIEILDQMQQKLLDSFPFYKENKYMPYLENNPFLRLLLYILKYEMTQEILDGLQKKYIAVYKDYCSWNINIDKE